ncbi:MAG: nickel pincer cofactor biosynthesis protein LarC [Magnetococcales bacterium]|nr:nickel pincer cofactor biosynthesis protein LarC [Magnetococcales bacterium]
MILHLDPVGGMAGDMFLAACLDLGLDLEELRSALSSLPVPFELNVEKSTNGGMAGTRIDVVFPHEHVHRHLSDIDVIVHGSALPEPVKSKAMDIFRYLAEAEATVHGIDVESVHFHEVGAVDAIVDICGAAFALWKLNVHSVTASPTPLGSGTVTCAHGVMPVPPPAVAELVRAHTIPIRRDETPGEWTTPTGAAILAGIVDRYESPSLNHIDAWGCGLGHREHPGRANVLRILACREQGEDAAVANMDAPIDGMLLYGAGNSPDNVSEFAMVREPISVLSTHIDDMNPEWFGPLWDTLFDLGAMDVALIPMTMKKGRPGTRLEVVAHPGKESVLAAAILRETTSLGVRVQIMDRYILPRARQSLETPWGTVGIIVAGGVMRPEYEDLAKLARKQGWSLPEAAQRVLSCTTTNDS